MTEPGGGIRDEAKWSLQEAYCDRAALPAPLSLSKVQATVLLELQNGQLKVAASLGLCFLGGGLADDLRLPMLRLQLSKLSLQELSMQLMLEEEQQRGYTWSAAADLGLPTDQGGGYKVQLPLWKYLSTRSTPFSCSVRPLSCSAIA